MTRPPKPAPASAATRDRAAATVARLRARLREAEDTLDAIRTGQVDALVVQSPDGDRVYTLEGADHRYRQLVESMNEGALLLARDGHIVYANARFAALVGQRLERLIAQRLHDVVPPSWHDHLDAVLAGRAGTAAKVELELAAAGGARVPVYLSATATWGDEQGLTCLIATDLSEQKRSQEALAAERLAASIVEQAAEGIVVCDLDGRVIRASRTAHAVAGGNPLLRRFEEAFPIHLAGDPRIGPMLITSVLRGETTNSVEVGLGDRVLLLSAAPVVGRLGEPSGGVVTFVDVTERRRAAEERMLLLEGAEAARVEAETANRAKDEFLAMLGHELRNPLAPILTSLELMRLRDDGALRRERAIIERQVRHVVRLVDDLLDVSRITEGKVTLDRHPIELDRIVARAIELAGPLIEERRHQLEVAVAADLWIDGDDTRLCQVVANLLINAAKYTEPGGHLRVRGYADGPEVVLVVADDGVGLSSEILPRLFERFVQGKRSIARSEGGLGLGLTIVRAMVELHGGWVTARSDGPGRGSAFEVHLPGHRPAAAPSAEPVRARAPTPVPRRVLVVDDNVDAANLLGEAIGSLGHATRVAYDGPSALTAAAGFEPDIALLDIGLPVMDGFELARLLRDAAPAIHLIAITGYGQDADRARTAAAGFDQHLVKPIKLEQLEALIARARG